MKILVARALADRLVDSLGCVPEGVVVVDDVFGRDTTKDIQDMLVQLVASDLADLPPRPPRPWLKRKKGGGGQFK